MSTEVEDLLMEAMQHDVGDVRYRPDLLSAARRRYRIRRIARATSALGAIGLAAVIGVAFLRPADQARVDGWNAQDEAVHVRAALIKKPPSIVYREVTGTMFASTLSVTWYDEATQAEGSRAWKSGKLVSESTTTNGAEDFTADFPSRTYWTYEAPPVTPGRVVSPAPSPTDDSGTPLGILDGWLGDGEMGADPNQVPAVRSAIVNAIADGSLTNDGQERRDGQSTLHLLLRGQEDGNPVRIDMWVDASSYQLVEVSESGSPAGTSTSIQWLPRTPANLATISIQIPEGFTHTGGPPQTG